MYCLLFATCHSFAMPERRFHFALLLLPLLLTACQPQAVEFSGPTMGSEYRLDYVPEANAPPADEIKRAVEAVLAEVDSAVSTYREDSAVARFNALPAGSCMTMPPAALAMAAHAQGIWQASEGAFDITLLPALRAWGFGPENAAGNAPSALPTDAALAELRTRIGQQHLRIENDRLCKDAPIQIEFNSIAAGYAIDRIADLLEARGIHRYLINVTGEMRGQGTRADGKVWQIGIEAPLDDARIAQRILPLDGKAISTSGDYRIFREENGQRYSHLIDPRSLAPVRHRLASVSVVSDRAMTADGLSTLLMVLGPDAGFAYAQSHGLAAFFITRQDEGFSTRLTPAFARQFPGQGETP